MQLPVVVEAEIVVVPAERLLGRRAMSWVTHRTAATATVKVLVSESVPETERPRVAEEAFRERRGRNVANDHDRAPESRLVAHVGRRRRPQLG